MHQDPILNEIMALDHQYYINAFGSRVPLCVDHGEGVWLYGTDGRRYLDMIGGIAVNVQAHGLESTVTARVGESPGADDRATKAVVDSR